MRTPKKFWFILIGTVLAMVIIACSFPTITPTPVSPASPTLPPPTVTPTPNATPTHTVTPTPTAHPMPELEGYWQFSNRAYAIAWQNGQYVVISVVDSVEGSLEITSQSWNGSTLTWTYYRPDSDRSITYTTSSISGDKLFINYSNNAGASGSMTLRRVSSAQPSYDSLSYYDDFSDPNSGWDVFNDEEGATGYSNGYYYSVSKMKNIIDTGYAYKYFGDTVIEVDATSVSGPGDDSFGFVVSCHLQPNYGSYAFEIYADGQYSVWLFTRLDTSTPQLSGDAWQYSSAINQGLATNHLVVTCAGSLLRLEVNGQVLFEGHDFTYSEGDLGLGAVTDDENNTPAEVHFDNLVVRAP